MAETRPRVCAVSYLNTVPLVWGMLHGPQKGLFEISFQVPSACADVVAAGAADIGIIPAFELLRQDLAVIPGAGIISHGAVRSILLLSKRPAGEIAVLAADSSSRTSVALARIILARRFGVQPRVIPQPPELDSMLQAADAAVIIGDPALRVDVEHMPYRVYDLGREWTEMTGLPMVFAVWAARKDVIQPWVVEAFQGSMRFGREHLEEIVRQESARRGFPPEFVRHYLTEHIGFELGPVERQGMELYLRYARELGDADRGRLAAPLR